jgi:glucosamine--fructose-6-phosphate aminotransferase (isomerizing)
MDKSLLQQEIEEQPFAAERLIKEQRATIEQVAQVIQTYAPRYIMFAARGSSDNAARYGQYLFGAANGLPVALATPSLFTQYHQPPNLAGALVVGISQSGQSPDIVSVLEAGDKQGALTVAITNNANSPLAAAAGHTINLLAGAEQSLAATKTFTTSLLSLAMLSAALAGDEARQQALATVPGLMLEIIKTGPEILKKAERYRYMSACVVISRGYNYATAYEIGLKLKELTYVLTEPYSSADFRHGPLAIVEHGFPVIAIVPAGDMAQEMLGFLQQLRQREAELIVISALDEALALAQTPLRVPPGIPEWMSPLINVLPGQIFAWGLTLAKGYDPDHPRGLRKVTLTR